LALLTTLPIFATAGDGARDRQADVLAIGLPIASFALAGWQGDRDGARAAAESIGLTAVTTVGLNALIHKNTPNDDADDAFPSGHSAIAFSSATFLQRRYGWRAGLPAFAAAGTVGWLRVRADEHDWTDVLGGAALGIASSLLFTRRWSEQVSYTPWITPDAAGLAVNARW